MSSATRVSVIYPVQPLHADPVVPFAKLVLETGARRLWLGQSMLAESHQVLAYLAGMGLALPVGIGVTLVALRHPYEAAIQARSLALLTGQPVVVGFGAGTPEVVSGLVGTAYRRPATMTANYAGAVRRLLAAPGRSPVPLPPVRHPPVEVAVGVLRPAMARAAGATADVAVTWMTPPAYVRDVLLPALARGAADRPAVPRVATVVHVAVARPARDPRRLAAAAADGHLREPHYADMLRRAGIPAEANAIVDAGLYAYGTPEEIAETVRGYRSAGVDEVILNPAGVALAIGMDEAMRDLREILEAVGN